jgi:hypothetical protein
VVDVPSLRFLFAALVGWLDGQQQEALAYLIEAHRIRLTPPLKPAIA